MMKKPQVGYILDGVEFIKSELLLKIEENEGKYLNFGIGVYSDKVFEQVHGRKPLKSYNERSHLASCIKGVDFVWEVHELDESDVKAEPPLYVDDGQPKPFHVVYAPGSYDLLHEGHLDHLLQCRRKGDILVVGVKSDRNVFETKGKYTRQTEDERMEIVKRINFVDHVILVTTRNKRWANERVKEIVGEPINVVMLGSDCKGQEYIDNPDGLMFIFTDRDPKVMETRSSTYLRQQLANLDNAQEATNADHD